MVHYPNLRALRMQHNYKQEYVADILGISQPEYSKLETGARKIDPTYLGELCKLYDVTIDVLLRQNPMPVQLVNDMERMQTQHNVNQPDMLHKMLDNYSFLLDNYVKQQQTNEKIIEKLINDLKSAGRDHQG